MGAITAALEYVSDKKARVFGKPSEILFKTICANYKTKIEDLVIVGDDVEFDILIPMGYGITGILVKTGKYNEELFKTITKKYNKTPNHIIDTIKDLTKIL
jgi:ribonucleotide monophosphatase NagD (HAD superfamily)